MANQLKRVTLQNPMSLDPNLLSPNDCLIKDAYRFRHWFSKDNRQFIPKALLESKNALHARAQRQLHLLYDEQLPIVSQRDKIKSLIENHQVVIIAGETGSGKTTQLPKMCLELGLGRRGLIGHTQPRRIAARACADRLAEELQDHTIVGHKIRFSDSTHESTFVKIMTDGILLAEIAHSPKLLEYEVLIIDEAHERSLNIDFLLGYVKKLLDIRKDLKVIITSATIDVQKFAEHFNNAPVLEVSGRGYPVTTHYLDESYFEENREYDLIQMVVQSIEQSVKIGTGNILIFFSTEKEIREAQKVLSKHPLVNMGALVCPLYARQSKSEQKKVFEKTPKRKIILSTNVAETSLTVPGVIFVIDTGLARISRYNYRSKIQRLPIEPISQSSANQRQGRCGRIAPGHCFRLFTKSDFQTRPQYTEPQILRTHLAQVILQMKSLNIGHIEDFDFISPPDERYIRDGYGLLEQLGAIDDKKNLTKLGREMSGFPIDVKLARMLITAKSFQCVSEVLILVAILSITDILERPMDKKEKVIEAHGLFKDPSSDFMTYLKVYQSYNEQKKLLTKNQLRKWCSKHFISYNRMMDLEELYHQLKKILIERKYRLNQDIAQPTQIHKALLSGLLGQVGMLQEKKRYLGARSIQFEIHPTSSLYAKPPKWLVCFELIETSKVFGRLVASIDPLWIEEIAPHLLKRQYLNPYFEEKRQQVSAFQKATLYGLPVVQNTKVHYGPINPKESREIFIKEALVGQKIHLKAPFLTHNQGLLEKLEDFEQRFRRKDILIDEETLYQFYDSKCPLVTNTVDFTKWLKTIPSDFLNFKEEELIQNPFTLSEEERFPKRILIKDMSLELSYLFEPGHEEDGVSVYIPKLLLNQLENKDFSWLVPGLSMEKAIGLLRSLPKSFRRSFSPIPEFAKAAIEGYGPNHGTLEQVLITSLKRMSGIEVPRDLFDDSKLSPHLKMRFVIVENNKTLYSTKNLNTKTQNVALSDGRIEQKLSEFTPIHHITTWNFGDIPSHVETLIDKVRVKVFPGLKCHKVALSKKDNIGGLLTNGFQVQISLVLFDNEEDRNYAHHEGILSLVCLNEQNTLKTLYKNLDDKKGFFDDLVFVGDKDKVTQLWYEAIIGHLYENCQIFTQKEFIEQGIKANKSIALTANGYTQTLRAIAKPYKILVRQLKDKKGLSPATRADIDNQLNFLFKEGFVKDVPLNWLQRYPIYLQALIKRLENYNPAKDAQNMAQISPILSKIQNLIVSQKLKHPFLYTPLWHVEEFRVSLYAQTLGTAVVVSQKRILKLMEEMGESGFSRS